MTHRDANGHFISDAEWERQQGDNGEPVPSVNEDRDEETPTVEWGQGHTPPASVFVETGRGNTAEVPAGSPFQPTIERLAEEAHYGGYFRVFLNGDELVNPEESPATIETGMRIVLTSYDKVA